MKVLSLCWLISHFKSASPKFWDLCSLTFPIFYHFSVPTFYLFSFYCVNSRPAFRTAGIGGPHQAVWHAWMTKWWKDRSRAMERHWGASGPHLNIQGRAQLCVSSHNQTWCCISGRLREVCRVFRSSAKLVSFQVALKPSGSQNASPDQQCQHHLGICHNTNFQPLSKIFWIRNSGARTQKLGLTGPPVDWGKHSSVRMTAPH